MLTDTLLRLFEISIATSFLILPLCLASRRINRRYGAKWKYYIWLLLAVRLMIPVNLPAVNGFSILQDLSQRQQIHTQEQPIQSQAHTGSQPDTVPSQSQEQGQPISEPPYSIDGTKENTEAQPTAIMNVADIAAIVWCVGFCVFSVFQLYVYYAFRREIFVDGRECENNHIHELVVSTNHAIGLRRTMPVIVSRKANSPMILGIFRPVLIIPREDYSSAELNMIVRHELTHCKRRDIAFKMFLTAVNALHWFNPFVYLMVREANADIELCCDADVLRNADSMQRKAYAESILTSMEREKGFVPVSTCFSNGGINKMKERLENIVDNGKRRSGIVLLAVTIVMSVLLGAFVSCGSDVHSQDDAKAANDLIAQNARVAQNQAEYQERYDALVKRYEETDAKRTEVIGQIDRLAIRRRKIERFIQGLKEQPDAITEFDAGGWAALVSTMTVNSKSDITFQLTSEMEIRI